MAEKNVVMVHPQIKGKAVASKTAFEKVWSKKGWTEAPKTENLKTGDEAKTDSKTDLGNQVTNVPKAPSAT